MRHINFRSFIYSALMLMLAVFASLIALNIPVLGAILIFVFTLLPLPIAFFLKKRLKTYHIATVIMTSCLCAVSIICFFVKVYSWLPEGYEGGTNCKIVGRVDDVYSGDSPKIILDDISIDGISMKGRLRLYINDSDNVPNFLDGIESGDKLSFTSSVKVRELVSGLEVKASYLRSDIRFLAWSRVDSIKVEKGKNKFSLTGYIKSVLFSNMGEKYGAVAYGMLTGDKNEISSETISDFSASGIAHILAVSGLHIGVIAGIISFVLRKLKVRQLPTFIVTLTVLILYAALAGFAPSVVRACIMFAVGSGALLLGEEKDGFNSLGVAATAVLTFSPLMMFESGFLMSVGAVFGLLVFSPIITRGLMKIKVPEKLASPIAATTSAQLGILPPLICFFGYLQTYSIIINIFMIPFMSFVFVVVFVALLFALIPPFGFLLKWASVLVRGMTVGASVAAMLPMAQIPMKQTTLAFLIYPLYFVASDFFNCKYRSVVKCGCGLMIIALLLVFALA